MPKFQGEKALRDRIAKALRVRAIPHHVWRELRTDVDMVLAGGVPEEDFNSLVEQARTYLRVANKGRPRKRWPSPIPVEKLIPRGLLRRAGFQAELMAAAAEQSWVTRHFRSKVLANQLLSRDEAGSLASSLAARWLSPEFFRRHAVPLGAHTCELRGPGEEAGETSLFWDPETVLHIKWASGAVVVKNAWNFDCKEQSPAIKTLAELRGLSSLPGSVLWLLLDAGTALARVYGWQPGWAWLFLLTGETPMQGPIIPNIAGAWTSAGDYRRVELSVAPWMSEAIVGRVYRHVRGKWFGLPGRAPTEQTLLIATFVARERAKRAERPSFATLLKLWNATHPNSRLIDRNDFRRRAERGLKLLLDPTGRQQAGSCESTRGRSIGKSGTSTKRTPPPSGVPKPHVRGSRGL